MNTVMVYTDGACSNNPNGPGGWSAILSLSKSYRVLSGYNPCTTNNMMELTAVVEAIKFLISKNKKRIVIHSDSAYVVNAINKGWIYNWAKSEWKTKQGKNVANAQLWKELYSYLKDESISIIFKKVPGHSGHTLNELADYEAKKQVEYAKQAVKEI